MAGALATPIRRGYTPSMRRGILLLNCILSACVGAQPRPDQPARQTIVRPDAFTEDMGDAATATDSKPKRRNIVLAILPIRNNTPDKRLDPTGDALADLLSAQLSTHPNLKLVERARINELIDEIARGDLGPVDSETAARYGRMLGANVLAFGSFGKIGNQHTITVRLVKVETSQIIGGANEYLEDLDNLGPHAQALSAKLITEMTRAR